MNSAELYFIILLYNLYFILLAKCTRKRNTRDGVKKITCKPGIGWVKKGTDEPYDPTETTCPE